MKYDITPAFNKDYKRLPHEHRRLFRKAVFEQFLPALDAGALAGAVPWPSRLRIHQLHTPLRQTVYSLTWNFASPDGRATFRLESTPDGPLLIWRRIGDHSIYTNP